MPDFDIVLPIRPVTKKTSNDIIKIGNFHKVMPSELYREWFTAAMVYAMPIRHALQRSGIVLPISVPVQVTAIFYRERLAGDLLGYEQALADWLQAPRFSKTSRDKWGRPKQSRDGAGIITDDALIESWDGSRLAKDADYPRIELKISTWQNSFALSPCDDIIESRG